MKKRIGVLTGGGDVPGLNPAMKAVVLNALDAGYEVLGIRRGWGGLLWYNLDEPSTHDDYIRQLSRNDVRLIDRTGGTFLHTSRTNPQKVRSSDVPHFLLNSSLGRTIDDKGTMDYTEHVLKVLDHLGIDALITIGGDDTLSYSVRLNHEGFPVVSFNPKASIGNVENAPTTIVESGAFRRGIRKFDRKTEKEIPPEVLGKINDLLAGE